MKNMILISCLIGSMILLTGKVEDVSLASSSYSQTNTVDQANTAVHSSLSSEIVVPSMAPPVEQRECLQLRTVNKISLYDDQAGVTNKMGQPDRILKDEHLPELETYRYPGMNVHFNGGIVHFVEIVETAEMLQIDDSQIPATIDALKDALGEPDYITEDGIAFERGEAVLKLFIDTVTRKLEYATYFHIYGV